MESKANWKECAIEYWCVDDCLRGPLFDYEKFNRVWSEIDRERGKKWLKEISRVKKLLREDRKIKRRSSQ
jgi:hypothetical protein